MEQWLNQHLSLANPGLRLQRECLVALLPFKTTRSMVTAVIPSKRGSANPKKQYFKKVRLRSCWAPLLGPLLTKLE